MNGSHETRREVPLLDKEKNYIRNNIRGSYYLTSIESPIDISWLNSINLFSNTRITEKERKYIYQRIRSASSNNKKRSYYSDSHRSVFGISKDIFIKGEKDDLPLLFQIYYVKNYLGLFDQNGDLF